MWFCSWFQINHTWFHEKTKIPPPGIFNPAGLINMPRAGCFVLEVLGMNRKNAMIKRANSETCPIRFIIRSQIVYYMYIYILLSYEIFNYAIISIIPPWCWQSRYQAFTPQLWKKHAKNLGRTMPTINHSKFGISHHIRIICSLIIPDYLIVVTWQCFMVIHPSPTMGIPFLMGIEVIWSY